MSTIVVFRKGQVSGGANARSRLRWPRRQSVWPCVQSGWWTGVFVVQIGALADCTQAGPYGTAGARLGGTIPTAERRTSAPPGHLSPGHAPPECSTHCWGKLTSNTRLREQCEQRSETIMKPVKPMNWVERQLDYCLLPQRFSTAVYLTAIEWIL